MPQGAAESILEFLTTENPHIVHVEDYTRPITTGNRFVAPKKVLPWDDFNFETLENIFGGKVMTELRRSNRGLRYPHPELDPFTEGIDTGEDTVNDILVRWTRPMVRTALKAVEGVFNHVLWVAKSRTKAPKSGPTTGKPNEEPTRVPPERKCKPTKRSSSVKAKSNPRPDGAGIDSRSQSNSSKGNFGLNSEKQDNRLPCEIKPGSYWTSYKLLSGELVDQSGEWRRNQSGCRDAAPLLQIFDYCVKYEARYGFLITSKEVLAVRVRPSKIESNRDYENLIEQLHDNGVMEYKAISWDNHRSGDDFRDLTINLAVWFLCILAGNDHRPQWEYGPLAEESLASKTDGNTQSLTQALEIGTKQIDPLASFTTQDTQSTGYYHTDNDEMGSRVLRRPRKRSRPPQLPQEESAKRRRAAKV